MSAVLRQLLTGIALFASAVALLPPQGFSLCVDVDGHLVIEAEAAAGVRCCVEEQSEAEPCAPASCAECIDVAIAQGFAALSHAARQSVASHPAVAPPMSPCDPVVRTAAHLAPAPLRVAPSPLESILLRI